LTDPSPADSGLRRRALVTGASSGIGRAFAQRLASDDRDLVVVARNGEALEALAAELRERRGVDVEVRVADLTARDDLRGIEACVAAEPGFDLLVNNAGFGTAGPFAESDPEEEEREILLNAVALTRLTRAALPGMIARGGGSIINVSSMAGLAPNPYFATYGATKAFVNSFTEAIHEELRGTGVRVQSLCPGFTRTDFQRRAKAEVDWIPDFAWMEADAVVDASLDALERGQLVCVPGTSNRLVAGVTGALPRGWVRRAVAASMGSRFQRSGPH